VRFSPRYLVVELGTALLSVALWQAFLRSDLALPLGLRVARYAYFFVFVSCLEILALIDAATKRLPDVLTLPGIPLFFLAGFAVDAGPWQERAIGLCAGYLVLRLIADFYYYVLKREGMGLGDAKLLALIGGVLGWKSLPFVLFGASFLGTAVAVPLLLLQRSRLQPSPTRGAASPEAPVPETAIPEASPSETTGPTAETKLGRIAVPLGPFLAAAAVLWLFVGGDVLPLFGF
jgi:leader peptidase (prepilin peptidase)/N-methyltransferase